MNLSPQRALTRGKEQVQRLPKEETALYHFMYQQESEGLSAQ